MHFRNLLGTALICLALLALGGTAQADSLDGVTFTLVQANLTGSPGDTIVWDYSIVNANPDNLLILVAGVTAPAGFADGSADSSNFFPVFLGAGGSATGALYEFLSDPGTPNSTNTGQFDVTILLDPFGTGTQIDLFENYSATIASTANVPEPGALTLLLMGSACCLPLFRKLL